MATNIFKFDGTILTTVADGTIDTTHSTLKFPGNGYQNYGPPILENILWTMENFAGAVAPALPLMGQCWYDSTNKVLKVYNGTSWQAAGGVLVNDLSPPSGSNIGAFWYDSANMQLYVWNGTAWDLVGPLGSSTNNDPVANTSIPNHSQFDSVNITDSTAAKHQAWRVNIGGQLFAIISKDATYTPSPVITGFPTISPGINFNNTVSNVGISGDTTTFRSTTDNLPNADSVRNMGSASLRFGSMFANNGIFNNMLVNTLTSTYNFQVTGTSFLNGTTLFMPGTNTAAPVRMQSGSLLNTPVLGALEFDGSQLYITLNVNGTPTRSTIAAGTSGGSTAAVANTLALRDSVADLYANVFHGVATSARYADIAERYETDTPVGPGDVVIIGGRKEITTTDVECSEDVFGVISTNPAYSMNSDAGSDETHPFVALVGRVPCKVVGQIRKGDRLVTSGTRGAAMAAPPGSNGVFARSLSDKDSDGLGMIEAVMLSRV